MAGSELVKVNVRLPKRQLDWLKSESAKVGSTYNHYIRLAVDFYRAQREKEQKNGVDAH